MFERIFPRQFDNDYRGYAIALWLLAPIALSKLFMGGNSIVNTRYVIEVADQLPLSSFDPAAAVTLVFMFKAWGLGLALLSVLSLVALARYRAMVPLMYLALTIEQVARRAFAMLDPLPVVHSAGGPSVGFTINLAFTALLLIGFALSVAKTERAAA